MENDACVSWQTQVAPDGPKDREPLCLPVVNVIEDKWQYIPVSAMQDLSEVDIPIYQFGEYTDASRSVMMTLTIDVEWGVLDVFQEELFAAVADDAACYYTCQGGDPETKDKLCGDSLPVPDKNFCKGGGVCGYVQCVTCCEETPSDIQKNNNICFSKSHKGLERTTRSCTFPGGLPSPKQIRYEYRGGVLGKHRLKVVGDWASLLSVLLNVKYKGMQDVTTMRLRAPLLSPESARTQPYETITYKISQLFSTVTEVIEAGKTVIRTAYTEADSGNLTVLVNIQGENDPPDVKNPQDTWTMQEVC